VRSSVTGRFGTTNVQQVAHLIAPAAAGGAVNIGNSATFSRGYQVNVTDAYVTVNGTRFPYASTATDFSTNKYAKWYRKYVEFYCIMAMTSENPVCRCIFMHSIPVSSLHQSHDTVECWERSCCNSSSGYDSKFIAHGENGRQVV
jgi:hypothetical protein